jgi:hypothetical protein
MEAGLPPRPSPSNLVYLGIKWKRPLSVATRPGLRHRPALRETPQHSKHPLRDDFLERRIGGRHSLRLHDSGPAPGQQVLAAEADAGPDEAMKQARAGEPDSF